MCVASSGVKLVWYRTKTSATHSYLRFGGLPWVCCGVGGAITGIIAIPAYKLTVRNVGTDKLLWAIYPVAAGVTAATGLPACPNPPMIWAVCRTLFALVCPIAR